MVNKPLKPCGEISCGILTRETYCEIHKKSAQEISQKIYRKSRDKNIDGFYKSYQWQRLRAVAYERDKGLCQRCLKRGTLKRADVVHHIVEVLVDWSRRFDLGNLESVCHACHNREHKTGPRG
nr:HNH endonuclease [Gracilibacillus orientalis]